VYYELLMFRTLARALATDVFGEGSLHNAVLESFTVHARNLLDFLFVESPREDDVVAADFLDSPEIWPEARGEMPEVLNDVNRRVGKEVVHLTYARLAVTPDQKPWPFLAITDAMQAIMTRFATPVPPSRLSAEWRRGEEPA
jgi:hypothetical protein